MDLTDRLRAALDSFIDNGYLPGYLVAVRRGDELTVVARGLADVERGHPMTPDTQFRLASLTKPVGALVTAQLIESGQLRLDDPIDRWLPEFAAPQVLRRPDAELSDTVDASRAITVNDLLTMSSGIGYQFGTPLGERQVELGLRSKTLVHVPNQPELDWTALASLPLAFQPGTGWAYEWSAELLTRIVVAASQATPAELVENQVRRPLGLDTLGYRGDADRLAAYYADEDGSGLRLVDPGDGAAATTGLRESLSHGLIGTAGDYLAILADLASPRPRLLDAESAAALRSPQLHPDAARMGSAFLGSGNYGFLVAVQTRDQDGRGAAGRFGWTGISGVQAYADPANDLVAGIFTQRGSEANLRLACFAPFWDAVYSG